jgi:hypothetical protein
LNKVLSVRSIKNKKTLFILHLLTLLFFLF